MRYLDLLAGLTVGMLVAGCGQVATPLPAQQPASIRVTSPGAGATLEVGAVTSVTAEVSPATAGTVSFILNGVPVSVDASAPYSFDFTAPLQEGPARIAAEVTFGNGRRVSSDPVTLAIVDPSARSAGAPQPMALATPASAVRSYCDWVSYAYAIRKSSVAAGAMTAGEHLRVDSYILYNLKNKRVLRQVLQSLSIVDANTSGPHAHVRTREVWIYRYMSSKTSGKTIDGPHIATYDCTYSLSEVNKNWVVSEVKVNSSSGVQ